MSPDAVLVLQQVIDRCHEQWLEAHQAEPGPEHSADQITGQKMAYNHVLQFARALRDGG